MLAPAPDILKTALKYSRLFVASRITADEYATNLLDSSAQLPHFDDATVRDVALSVPDMARSRVAREIDRILAQDYKYPYVHIGGPGPSGDERERIRQLYETRVRTFAAALGTALSMGGTTSNT